MTVTESLTIMSYANGAGITKHLHLRWQLEQAILRGDYRVGDRLPTHRDLMRIHQCSTATVARALRNMVQAGLIERRPRSGTIVTAVPPASPLTEHNPSATTVGLFHAGFPRSFHPFFSGLVEGLTRGTDASNFALKVITVPPEGLILDSVFEDRYGIAGFVAIIARASEMQAAVDLGIPCVFTESAYPEITVERVLADDRVGARLAFEHLRQLGHRRLAVCCAFEHQDYREVAAQALDCLPERVPLETYVVSTLVPRQVRSTLAGWQSTHNRATAMLVTDDVLLKLVWQDIENQGLRIPEDLALVGLGSPLSARFIERPATFVETDPVAWGQRAVDRVVAQLRGAGEPARIERIPPQLVVRASSGSTL